MGDHVSPDWGSATRQVAEAARLPLTPLQQALDALTQPLANFHASFG
uniref:Uncharacterized protein n=1 Tax=Thiothrix fructosivorans TaxID=111770 RepID=A0A8B0SVQ2_9GAMM|nr:hypothetical protein J1836_020335 [Thiothrix fructosivorans]